MRTKILKQNSSLEKYPLYPEDFHKLYSSVGKLTFQNATLTILDTLHLPPKFRFIKIQITYQDNSINNFNFLTLQLQKIVNAILPNQQIKNKYYPNLTLSITVDFCHYLDTSDYTYKNVP